MRTDHITIDNVRYHVLISVIKLPCEECALKGKDCKNLCEALARFNNAHAVKIVK